MGGGILTDIDKLEGFDLATAVALARGWQARDIATGRAWFKDGQPVRMWDLYRPDSDISAAWELVEEMGWHSYPLMCRDAQGWYVRFEIAAGEFAESCDKTMPAAICRAYLKAKSAKAVNP